MADNDDSLEWDYVAESCDRLIRSATSHLKAKFGLLVPRRIVTYLVYRVSEPGKWQGEEGISLDTDWPTLAPFVDEQLKMTSEWQEAERCFIEYVDRKEIEPASLWQHDINMLYLRPLLRTFIGNAKQFRYNASRASRLIKNLHEHLQDSAPKTEAWIVLQGFSADRPFALTPDITIAPIQEEELRVLGRNDGPPGFALFARRPEVEQPRDDWWLCRVRVPNPRGTAIGSNYLGKFTETLTLALRAFKAGNAWIGLARSQIVGPYGVSWRARGSSLQQLSSSGDPYSLTRSDIRRLTTFGLISSGW